MQRDHGLDLRRTGTPNREPEYCSRSLVGICMCIYIYMDLGKYIPIVFLLYSWAL